MVLLVLLLSQVTELRLLEDDHHGKLQFEIYILFYKYSHTQRAKNAIPASILFFHGQMHRLLKQHPLMSQSAPPDKYHSPLHTHKS